jgi:hypothetical protein
VGARIIGERENPLKTLVERINSDSPGRKEESRQP